MYNCKSPLFTSLGRGGHYGYQYALVPQYNFFEDVEKISKKASWPPLNNFGPPIAVLVYPLANFCISYVIILEAQTCFDFNQFTYKIGIKNNCFKMRKQNLSYSIGNCFKFTKGDFAEG